MIPVLARQQLDESRKRSESVRWQGTNTLFMPLGSHPRRHSAVMSQMWYDVIRESDSNARSNWQFCRCVSSQAAGQG